MLRFMVIRLVERGVILLQVFEQKVKSMRRPTHPVNQLLCKNREQKEIKK